MEQRVGDGGDIAEQPEVFARLIGEVAGDRQDRRGHR
jgi:hypothetical protein